mmetsp:Transcript_53130/g.137245  ORF Transcript_53130/g.137245 Transcript_53130/m.137245 type:complete len:568 (+) Transcript_53130:99-1802(+)
MAAVHRRSPARCSASKAKDEEASFEVHPGFDESTPLVPCKAWGDHPCYPLVSRVAQATGLDDLVHHFGYKLLVMLCVSQHLMKGFAATFTGPCVQYLYSSYQVAGPQMQIYSGVTSLPWAMKPVIGLISDTLPLGGYHKAPYIALASIFGITACASIGVVPHEHMSIARLVICLFMMQLQLSTCDLLTEAKYAEKMRLKPEQGPALMTYVWFGLQFAGLVAVALIGPIMKHFGNRVPFLIALLPMSLIIIPVAKNYLEETPLQSDSEARSARMRLTEQKEAVFLCMLIFAGTIALSLLGIMYESATVNAVGALTVALVMLISFSLVLRPVIAKVNAFFLVQTSLGISIGGASFYFYTDTPEQYPEGPHFSQEFFTSVLGVIGSLCSLVGIYSYQRFACNWSYRGLLLFTNVLLSLLSVSDIVMFTRLNVRLGLPDHAFVLGASVLTTVIAQWMWMPGVVLMSQLCPAGMEATMYALLAGCHNLGNTIASNCGALVLEWLQCSPSGAKNESAQFQYLWVGSALSTVMPLITLALLPWLIPDAKQTDKLLEDDDKDPTEGSLLRRLLGN